MKLTLITEKQYDVTSPCKVINLCAKGQFKISKNDWKNIFVVRFVGNHVKQIIIRT